MCFYNLNDFGLSCPFFLKVTLLRLISTIYCLISSFIVDKAFATKSLSNIFSLHNKILILVFITRLC